MQTIRAWEAADNLTIAGLKRFFAVDLYMDVVERKGDIRGYWSNSVWGDDYVRELLSRDRFLLIRYNLTWTNTANLSSEERSQKNTENGFWTVSSLFTKLNTLYQTFYKPLPHLSVDEMCIFFKGRHRCRCYNPSKPNKWHLKLYCLCCGSTGYIVNTLWYRGKDERRPADLSASEYPVIALTEIEELYDDSYSIYMDNWFTSIKLALKLMTEPRCMGVVGTIRTNRKGVPKKAIYQKRGGRAIDRGSMKVHKITINGKDLFLTAWKDNKEVHVVSSFMPNRVPITRLINNNGRWERKRFFCPTSVKQYNMKMGGVDKIDQYASYYDDRRKVQTRWQPRVERRAMKNSLINACIYLTMGRKQRRLYLTSSRMWLRSGEVPENLQIPMMNGKTKKMMISLSQSSKGDTHTHGSVMSHNT
jgi:hypothetical protein